MQFCRAAKLVLRDPKLSVMAGISDALYIRLDNGTAPSVDNDAYGDNDVARHVGQILTTLVPPVLVCIFQRLKL